MGYLGIDIGGTFTDVVHLADDGSVLSTKVSSTPPRFENGFFEGVEKIAGLRGVSVEELLGGCESVLHGTTVATNAIVENRGARVGMITSRGHRATLPVMRASGKIKGLNIEQMLHASGQYLPKPIVEPDLIREVNERVDSVGNVVVALDEDEVRQTVRALMDDGVEAIAICFLWAIAASENELRVKEIIAEMAPDIYVACSHEASARIGEFERFTAAALNAALGPETSGYLSRVHAGLTARGLSAPLLIMQASGGMTPEARARNLPTQTIGSGPAAGVAASSVLAGWRNEPDVIATDMGGTSFDVALIADSQPVRSPSTIVNQYEFFLPRIDIRSIGSGGGSIIAYNESSHSIRVGPQSAGAYPGPVCYGRGGTRATLTDANLVLGYLDPDLFLGGDLRLDVEAAYNALEEAGRPLGFSAVETALAARRIVNAQMADLIRQMTVERGLNPQDFAVYAYGGAAGLHVAGYLAELGCQRGIVPLGVLSTTWSAYGCATSEIVHINEKAVKMSAPLDSAYLSQVFQELEEVTREELDSDGVDSSKQVFERTVEMKYPLQIHHVEVSVVGGALDDAACLQLEQKFAETYELLYGRGASFVGARPEIVSARVIGRGALPQPATRVNTAVGNQEGTRRSATWQGPEGPVELETTVLSPDGLNSEPTHGPLIVSSETTTIIVPPGASARVDERGNLVIEVAADSTPVFDGSVLAGALVGG